MRKLLTTLLTAVCLPAFAESVSLQDDRGITITLQQPAKRIISLAPHITENLFAIGSGQLIVGVTSYNNYPAEANDIELVGTYKDFDIEKIISLKPDIVIGWVSGNPEAQIKRIERFDVPVFLSEPRTFEGIARELTRFGILTGRTTQATQVAELFLGKIRQLRESNTNQTPLSVFYQIWDNPMITLNGEHLISRLIEACGGRNIFSDQKQLAPRISEEAVIDRDPQVIIASGMGHERPPWLDEWLRFDFLDAVRNTNLFHIHPDLIERHTIRVADGMREICAKLQEARQKSG